jgi:YHS domain-containing protein
MVAGSETGSLSQRIKAEFDGRIERMKATEHTRAQEADARAKRLEQFGKTCDDLKAVWRPRFEEFSKQFGENIKVTPTVTRTQREAKVEFLTELATMTLTLSASTDPEVTKLVLDYDLLIIPIFFEYDRHTRLEMPLDKIDRDAVGKWIDDRLVACVKAYLSMQDNQYYLSRAMVEDPISKAKLLPQDAAAKLDYQGKTYYFSSEDSLRTFKERLEIKS